MAGRSRSGRLAWLAAAWLVLGSVAAFAREPVLMVQLGHSSRVSSIAVGPDSRYALSCSWDDTIRLWDLASGREIRVFRGSGYINKVAYDPLGRYALAASFDGSLMLWNLRDGEPVWQISDRDGHIQSLDISPDGRFILTGGSTGRLLLRDMESGDLLAEYTGDFGLFSPDGTQVVCSKGVWDIASGQQIVGFELMGPLLALSSDGSQAVLAQSDVAGEHYYYTVLDTHSGAPVAVRTLEGPQALEFEPRAAFLPDGRVLFSYFAEFEGYSFAGGLELWSPADGTSIRFEGHEDSQGIQAVTAVAVSPDGRYGVSGGNNHTLIVWDLARGERVHELKGYYSRLNTVAVSPDEKYFYLDAADGVLQWEFATGKELRFLKKTPSQYYASAISRDCRYAVTGNEDLSFSILDLEQGVETARLPGHQFMHTAAVISPDGRFAATGDCNGEVRAWDMATGANIWTTTLYINEGFGDCGVFDLEVTPDSQYLLGVGKGLKLWEAATGRELAYTPIADIGRITSAVILADGHNVLLGREYQPVLLWDLDAWQALGELKGLEGNVSAVAVSPDGRRAAAGDFFGGITLWDAEGNQVRKLSGHQDYITSLAFVRNGSLLLSTSTDSTIRFWDAANGAPLATAVSSADGVWAVVDPHGRYDSNSPGDLPGFSWIVPDDPFTALPVEIFMREYFEPRLLPRVLAGEDLGPAKNIEDLNRVQPEVEIVAVEPDPEAPDEVTVKVRITDVEKTVADKTLRSGIFDLRLFRDGQLVGYAPLSGGEIKLKDGKTESVGAIRNVKLPRIEGKTEVEFSAYAFNADGVKSATHKFVHPIPAGLEPLPGKAYVICIGVNAYENPGLDLRFAANDARIFSQTISSGLAQSGRFADVVPVTLVSDAAARDGSRILLETTATKEAIKAVIDVLAGAEPPPVLAQVENADRLSRARPEDVVVLAFASHGYADNQGDFYLLPYDVGQSADKQAILARSISSRELALWLRDVDAGTMAMIVDACHSAASVEGDGFKPSPMASRGLGQLAYDKGMRILASTQADDVALESALIQHGLLTHALTHDGLLAAQADFEPANGRIMLGEWLKYAEQRVPDLYEEIQSESLRNWGLPEEQRAVVVISGDDSPAPGDEQLQRPSLFDFNRAAEDIPIRTLQ